jgi:hypothetical protein
MHNLAQRRIGGQAPRRALVQAQAAQRSRIGCRGGVIPRCAAAAIDRNPSLGTQAVEDAPERWLADTRAYQVCEFRRSEARRLHRQKSQYLLARCRPHDVSPTLSE